MFLETDINTDLFYIKKDDTGICAGLKTRARQDRGRDGETSSSFAVSQRGLIRFSRFVNTTADSLTFITAASEQARVREDCWWGMDSVSKVKQSAAHRASHQNGQSTVLVLRLKSESDALWVFLSTSQKLPELPRSLRSPLEDILWSALQHKMMAAARETAEVEVESGRMLKRIAHFQNLF